MGSPGYAEVFIPLENLQLENIRIHPPTSPYPIRIPTSILSYTTTFTMPKLSVLTPFLKVHSWDFSKGRLELVVGDMSHIVLNLQELLIQKIVKNPAWSSLASHSYDEVKGRFQPIVTNGIIPLYLNNQGPEGISVHTGDTVKYISESALQHGQQVRVALRFQGLVFLKNTNGGLFYRLQHQVTRIYCK
jgi:hypothetical protein